MKAAELRIGNWFKFGELEHEATHWDIRNLRINELKKRSSEAYKPIPLTEEWLLRFGFETRTTTDNSVQYFIGFNFITCDWLFDIIWLDGDSEPFYKNGFHKIKYVHQLQNLYFALTEEELTIKE